MKIRQEGNKKNSEFPDFGLFFSDSKEKKGCSFLRQPLFILRQLFLWLYIVIRERPGRSCRIFYFKCKSKMLLNGIGSYDYCILRQGNAIEGKAIRYIIGVYLNFKISQDSTFTIKSQKIACVKRILLTVSALNFNGRWVVGYKCLRPIDRCRNGPGCVPRIVSVINPIVGTRQGIANGMKINVRVIGTRWDIAIVGCG